MDPTKEVNHPQHGGWTKIQIFAREVSIFSIWPYFTKPVPSDEDTCKKKKKKKKLIPAEVHQLVYGKNSISFTFLYFPL